MATHLGDRRVQEGAVVVTWNIALCLGRSLLARASGAENLLRKAQRRFLPDRKSLVHTVAPSRSKGWTSCREYPRY